LLSLHEVLIPASDKGMWLVKFKIEGYVLIFVIIHSEQAKSYRKLLKCMEQLMLKLDDTLLEARKAREAMLLFIQVTLTVNL